MDASLDTCILINLYSSGSEELLFEFFDELYFFEGLHERELKTNSISVYNKINKEIENGRIKLITIKDLIGINMKSSFEHNLLIYKDLYDAGEWQGIALAATLGHEAFLTDDIKDFGPHYSLLRETVDEIIPFSFYELLYLKFLCGMIDLKALHTTYDGICNKINWPIYRKNSSSISSFEIHMGKTIKRFSTKFGTDRDIHWISQFCISRNINYKNKYQELYQYLTSIQKN